jgi:hypothetical protein
VTSIVLLVLVAAWAGYLFLWWKDARGAAPGGRNGMRSFSRQLGSLGGNPSRSPMASIDAVMRTADLGRAPRTANAAARRRRDVLVALCALATLSLLTVPILGDRALVVHVLFDLTLLAYGYGLIRRRHLSAEREIKVRMLYPDRPTAAVDPVVVPMRRTANG